jgi:hypothetical protein
VEKMRFFLKASKWMYGLETGHTVRSVTADVRLRAWTYGLECDRGLYFHQVVT